MPAMRHSRQPRKTVISASPLCYKGQERGEFAAQEGPGAEHIRMKWYYAAGGEPVGPVSEEEFIALRRQGQIRDDSLVWKEGMRDWEPWGQVYAREEAAVRQEAALNPLATAGPTPQPALAPGEAAQGGGRRCTECGRSFPADEVVQVGIATVCAECKPLFLQRLREGVYQPTGFVYAGFWIRFAALLIDWFILTFVEIIAWLSLGLDVGRIFVRPLEARRPEDATLILLCVYVIPFVVHVAYETLFLAKLGATPGKMAVGVRVLSPEGKPISVSRSLGRYFAKILSSMILYIGFIMVGFDSEKRALHDYMANTRVIRV